jgi:hypothetical protein
MIYKLEVKKKSTGTKWVMGTLLISIHTVRHKIKEFLTAEGAAYTGSYGWPIRFYTDAKGDELLPKLVAHLQEFDTSLLFRFVPSSSTETGAPMPSAPAAKSQKIIGLLTAQNYKQIFVSETHVLSPTVVTAEEFLPKSFGQPLFGRGCPVRPRHGFEDSIVVKTKEEAKALWDRVRAADPEGEMMFSPFLKADYNAIWTPTSLSVGPKHDGATAGRDCVSIPLVEGKFTQSNLYKELHQAAKLTEGEVPYIEVVYGGGETTITQVRSGPSISLLCPDLIQEETLVEHVVETAGDLLEWEKTAKEFKPGTVVWHPKGTLTSHYSVHAFLNKIPVMISRKPVVGEVLKPQPIPPIDHDSFIKGAAAAFNVKLGTRPQWRDALYFSLMALHNSLALTGKNSWVIGAGAALLCRVGLGLALGETRHLANSSNHVGYVHKGTNAPSRDQIYEEAIKHYWHNRLFISHVIGVYRHYKWWNGGFGGPKWGNCAEAMAKLDNLLMKAVQQKTVEAVNEVVSHMNTTVHVAHNGGCWLNKIIMLQEMDKAAAGQPACAVAAGSILYRIAETLENQQATVTFMENLPPVIDVLEIPKTTITKKVKKQTKDDVPQIYDLSYPKIEVGDDVQIQLGKVDFMQARVADNGVSNVKIQFSYPHPSGSQIYEPTIALPLDDFKKFKELHQKNINNGKTHNSLANTHVQYSRFSPVTAKLVAPGNWIEISAKWEDINFAYKIENKHGDKKVKPTAWWMPGVKINVTFEPKYEVTETQEEVNQLIDPRTLDGKYVDVSAVQEHVEKAPPTPIEYVDDPNECCQCPDPECQSKKDFKAKQEAEKAANLAAILQSTEPAVSSMDHKIIFDIETPEETPKVKTA